MTVPTPMRVVFDTSVPVAAARSRQGASFAIVNSIPSPEFQICLSVGLYNVESNFVRVIAFGEKRGNRLFVEGREFHEHESDESQ